MRRECQVLPGVKAPGTWPCFDHYLPGERFETLAFDEDFTNFIGLRMVWPIS
jgi:hypothetical protein